MKYLLAMALTAVVVALPQAAHADDTCTAGEPCGPTAGPPGTDPYVAPTTPDGPPRPAASIPFHHPYTDCVTTREWRGTPAGITKAEVEQRWEVVGLGRRKVLEGFGQLIIYPRCGYRLTEGWYGVRYDRGRVDTTVGLTT